VAVCLNRSDPNSGFYPWVAEAGGYMKTSSLPGHRTTHLFQKKDILILESREQWQPHATSFASMLKVPSS
jgi:hypothetical protein